MGLETGLLAATSIIGTGLSAYGQYQKGVDARKAGQSAQQAAFYNAGLSQEQAKAVANKQIMNEYKMNIARDEAIGRQRAAAAAGGVVSISGSPLDIMTESLSNANLDIAIDRYNAQIAEAQLGSQAEQYLEEGQTYLEEGEQKYRAGLIGAGVTVAKGAADIYTNYIGE